jgi:D-beta-D-heptose 7-phosphate kinase/D-beta-D-heptose 1-phosphate adenosyltransferase
VTPERSSAPIGPAELLPRLPGTRVWVLGDVMLDEYVEGDVHRISPEAPVPVLQVTGLSYRLGGAANVALNARALGGEVELFGITGLDPAGAVLRDRCEGAGIGIGGLQARADRSTIRKQRVLARGRQLVRIDFEGPQPLPGCDVEQAMGGMASLPQPDAIAVSDYSKGYVSPALFERVIAYARVRGIPVLVDPKGSDVSIYEGATIIKPNLAELQRLVGHRVSRGRDDVGSAARELLERSGAQAVIVTRGDEGMLVVAREGGPEVVEAPVREVYDVTGAGDTVLAVLAMCVGADRDVNLVSAAHLAARAGALAVEKIGTATVTIAQIARTLTPRQDKRVELATLEHKAALWRLQGKRIVFTNGCFDLLHVGHLTLFEKAATYGDVLVVALNSDASVARLKGAGRPIVPERERAALIAALACVDAVVVFDEDDPLGVIERVRPKVLVKGGDYAKDEVIGRDFVERSGGRVVLVPLTADRSTSRLVNRIRTT